MAEHRNIADATANRKAFEMFNLRSAGFVVLTVSMAALASCGTPPQRDSHFITGSIENDYRVRHPITMAEAEHSIDIPVASGDHRLPSGMTDSIRGFAQRYRESSSGVVQIALPSGAVNSTAARHVLPQVRKELINVGVKPRNIITASYQAPSAEVSAPIRLSFVAITAMTNECGRWPQDLMSNSMENKNWYNFGCASQQNLAAQVANPKDLFDPRGTTPIDAERRANVINSYRQNGGSAGN